MNIKTLLLAFLGFMMACHKDTDVVEDEEVLDPPKVEVTTKLVSQTDTTLEAARHATQSFAGLVTAYPSFPYLVTQGNQVDRDFELITLTTQDNHQFYQVPSLVENDINYQHWQLPDVQTVEANSTNDVDVVINGDFSIHIPADALLLSGNASYAGNYTLAYSLLDPATQLADAIPSYIGLDVHQRHALEMSACFYITAFASTGEKLHFASTAAIIINTVQHGEHWIFNPVEATWHPNTSSQTNHFSLGSATYYAIAQPTAPVRLTGNLVFNGQTAPHQRLLIRQGNITRTVYTTNKGAWACYVPAQKETIIEVPLPCNDHYTTSLITPDQDEFSLPLSITHHASINSVFRGTFRNNQGAEIQEGILILDGVEADFLYSAVPAFTFNIPMCPADSIGVKGLDIVTNQSGPSVRWLAADTVNLYSVFACEESKMEYLSLNVNSDIKMYWDLKSSVSPESRVLIEEGSAETELDLQIAISGMSDRAYLDEELNIRFEDRQLGTQGYSLYCPTSTTGCGFSTFIITHYPDSAGEWIRGYFEGEFWIKTFHPLTAGYKPVRGEFQVYREF